MWIKARELPIRVVGIHEISFFKSGNCNCNRTHFEYPMKFLLAPTNSIERMSERIDDEIENEHEKNKDCR